MTTRNRSIAALLLAAACGSAGSGCSREPATERTGDFRGAPQDAIAIRDSTAGRWNITPGVGFGALTLAGSEAELTAAYGAPAVRATSVELGEGETAPGTLLFPDEAERRVQIIWADSTARRTLSRIVLRGERSRWMLPENVSLGTSLKELEEKNGRPFLLAGFGWDYAGVVVSWNGGALERALRLGVKIYLEPRIEDRAGPNYRRVLGDREYSSALPPMQALNPRVYQIFVDFTPPAP